jgi:hypothetical protein
MDYKILLEKIALYAVRSFEQTPMGLLPYHNQKHTESVTAHAALIAVHYTLNDRDTFIVVASAWLHDLGYTIDRNNHEEKGAEAAGNYLAEMGIPEEDIHAVKGCILATKLPQAPHNLLEEIVCDSDLFHLGTIEFPELNKAMRKEVEEVNHTKINKDEWRRKTIGLMESHQYYTDYSQSLLNDQKQRNIDELKEKSAAKLQNAEISADISSAVVPDTEQKDHKNKEDKHFKHEKDKPERGIETMFRVSSSNHQRLSDMADNKAHIMITVNSIILSAVISLLLRKLDENSYLMIPTFLLLASSLITIIFSILATRPTIPNGVFTKKDIEEKKVNLLFFGNYYRMPLQEYKEGMGKMMNDKEFLYGSLIMDGYAQGIVLGKKYRLLRISYSVFMFGLILSVIAFILASAFYGK